MTARYLLARAAARTGHWSMVIRLLSRGPLTLNTAEENGLLSYAIAMQPGSPATQAALARLLSSSQGSSGEANLWLAEFHRRAGDAATACRLYRETHPRNDWPKHHRDAAEALAHFTCGYLDGTLQHHLAAAIARLRLHSAEPLLLTVAGSNALPLYGLWRQQAARLAPRTSVVLALDPPACHALHQAPRQDAPVHVLDLSPWIAFDSPAEINRFTRHSLWTLRVMVLRALVAAGHPVVSLDLDAVLLSSLDALLASLPPGDIVAQKDYSLPMDAARKLGWTACCGVMAFQPSPAVHEFLNEWQERTFREGDDQMALNHLILESGVSGLQTTAAATTFQVCGLAWCLPDSTTVSRSLDSGSAIRHFTRHGETLQEIRARLGLPDRPQDRA